MSLEQYEIQRAGEHVRVDVAGWGAVAEAAKAAGYTYFSFLSGVDWLINETLDGEKTYDPSREPKPLGELVTDEATRVAGGESRFSVVAHLRNVVEHTEVTLYADLDESLTVPTWTHVFPGADWHEREAWEMFGFTFTGHPGLRHIYLPDEFEGHPLRKDYLLASRIVRPWPGLVDMEEMPKVEQPPKPADEKTEEKPAQ